MPNRRGPQTEPSEASSSRPQAGSQIPLRQISTPCHRSRPLCETKCSWTDSTHFDTPNPVKSMLCETKSPPRPPTPSTHFDTFSKIEAALRNEMAPGPIRHISTSSFQHNQRLAKRNRPGPRRPARHFSTSPHSPRSTPRETKSPRPGRSRNRRTTRNPHQINTVRNEMTSALVARQPEMVIAIR